MNTTLEICTDASIKTFDGINRTFGCFGAICINSGEIQTKISPDTTNNRSELLGIYLGCKMAVEHLEKYPGLFTDIKLYSDSQFGIFGLTKWMDTWLDNKDANGILYGTNKRPVKNQELFKSIISYLYTHGVKIKMLHQKGHVRYNSVHDLANANSSFYTSNGYYLRPEDIYKISYYNDIIDRYTRDQLEDINPSDYKQMDYSNNATSIVKYIIPNNYLEYVCSEGEK